MFELEQHIENWKNKLRANDSCTTDNVSELECHLREMIDSYIEKGLSEKDAFQLSELNVGTQNEITQEFCKVNSSHVWKKRIFWGICGYFTILLVQNLTAIANIFYNASEWGLFKVRKETQSWLLILDAPLLSLLLVSLFLYFLLSNSAHANRFRAFVDRVFSRINPILKYVLAGTVLVGGSASYTVITLYAFNMGLIEAQSMSNAMSATRVFTTLFSGILIVLLFLLAYKTKGQTKFS